jgi:hypothetical protein
MRVLSYISVLLIAAVHSASAGASAQQLALAPAAQPEFLSQEPDSVQISWTAPCDGDSWLLDTETGCRMWDWHPDEHDKAVWSGERVRGQLEGSGIVQWTEHGQPIDRFEGTYRNGRREGFGRYAWNATDRFEGNYVNDVPQGFGTAEIAGETFAGDWQNGCMKKGERVVAIGVPRLSCGGPVAAQLKP